MTEPLRVYIAGPYTATAWRSRETNIAIARDAAVQVWKLGHAVLCPHMNTAHMDDEGIDHATFMRGDLAWVQVCDVVLMLPGWGNSPGAKEEHEFATRLGIPVVYSMDEFVRFAGGVDE